MVGKSNIDMLNRKIYSYLRNSFETEANDGSLCRGYLPFSCLVP